MFIGRQKELAELTRLYHSNNFELAVVYGRRRVGKTWLVDQFIKNKKHIAFSAKEVNDRINLDGFLKQVQNYLGNNFLPKIDNWEEALNYFYEQTKNEKIILVIDEYPYAAKANLALNSILQHFIDKTLIPHSQMLLILCGSQVSLIKDELLSSNSPLFGRKTTPIYLSELDYLEAAEFLPAFTNIDKILFYSCIGGTPYYLPQVDNTLTFASNLQNLFFDVYGSLYTEPIMLLYQELPEPKLYNSIIQAVASGATKLNEIHQATYIEKSTLSKYLKTLINLKIIKRTVPFDANPLKNKNSCYEISNNLYRFWFRFIFPNQEEIERGRGQQIFKKLVLPKINEFASKPSFEKICLDFLYQLELTDDLPIFPRRSGSWRGKSARKDGQEIEFDLIMDNLAEKEILIGECKWRNEINDVAELKKLIENATVFSDYQNKYFVFFSKVPYSKQAIKFSSAHGKIRLYTVDDLFSINRVGG